MKYIIGCLISLGIMSAGMAQDYSDGSASVSGKSTRGSGNAMKDSSEYFDKNAGEFPSVDPYSNDHFNPDRNKAVNMDNTFSKGSFMQDLKGESSAADINNHLSINTSSENEARLVQALRQTGFGKACLAKRQESDSQQSDVSSAKSFKMKDRNLKAKRKANGEERIRFHDKNESLVYHQKKNGQSHYKYLYKEGNSLLRVEKRKNEQGFVIFSFNNLEQDLPVLMESGAFLIERDVNSCMR
jgi:hypothetical protein